MGLIAIMVVAMMLWAVSLWHYPAETVTAFVLIACGAGYYVWSVRR